MLYLIGLGVGERDITETGINAIKASELVFLDSYTAYVDETKLEMVKKLSRNDIKIADRHMLEEGIDSILLMAENKAVSIITNGDPLIATTHKIILIEARKRKIPVKVIHSTSIFSVAIADSGLDFYRFGPVCTIPRWSEHYKPVSFYETILLNYSNGLHSLVLLDYDSEKGNSIRVEEAISIMEKAEAQYKKGIISSDRKIVLLYDSGTENPHVTFSMIRDIKAVWNYKMAAIIIPGRLSDIESEFLEQIEKV
jgi:diphthine synthase